MSIEKLREVTHFNSWLEFYCYLLNEGEIHPGDHVQTSVRVSVKAGVTAVFTIDEIKIAAFDEMFTKLATLSEVRELMKILHTTSDGRSAYIKTVTDILTRIPAKR